jgi:hypothetical protein
VLDAMGYLYVVDSHHHRIIRATSCEFECLVGCSGESGSASSQLDNPQTMVFDPDGNMLVTDFNNHRIQKFMLIKNRCGMLVTSDQKRSKNFDTVFDYEAIFFKF